MTVTKKIHQDNLSIAVLVKNERENIEDCIRSIDPLGEVTVTDTGSTDGTVEYLHENKLRYQQTVWKNFSMAKQSAVDFCINQWVLIIDADERVTPALESEIRSLDLADPFTAYAIPRQSFFLGRPVRYCGWRPDYVVRLFNRDICQFNNLHVHESIAGYRQLVYLKNSLLHFSYRSQTDVVRKVQQYAELGAEDLMAKKRKIGILTPPYHGVWAFMKTFLFRLGILDGKVGWRIAQMNAQTTYKKYQLARERLIRLRK